MSWLVENYIINRESIKSSSDINSDEYMDILIIEMLVEKLNRKGIITNKELRILNLVSSGYTFDDVSKEMDLSRPVISVIFSMICRKIAFILGGYFTNDGFLEYIREKYDFNDETMEKISNFITHSSRRHMIKRTNFLLHKEIDNDRT